MSDRIPRFPHRIESASGLGVQMNANGAAEVPMAVVRETFGAEKTA